MRAVVYSGPKQVAITDVAERPVGPGQVRLKVAFNGICGTDLHEYYAGPIFVPTEPHPLTGEALPVVLGHEFSGTVTEVGSEVTSLVVGDRVTVLPVYSCGECLACQGGRPNVCAKVGFHGLSTDGGMAETTVVDEGMAFKLPDSVSLELGALTEPMAVAYHAVKLGDPDPSGTALVFGAGPIGIGLWFALKGQGIDDVFVVEPSPVRRESIERLGAKTIDPTSVDIPAFIAEHTGGNGVTAAYDAAGVTASVQTALACLGAARTMVSVAIYEKPLETPLIQLVLREARIQGTLCYTADDYRAVIELMAAGHYDTTGWLETIAMDDLVTEGFEALHAGQKMKVLVDPSR
ncbi:2,3-butanediol dehydrogenase [Klenkia taihuensis]|uniref:(R,R)-butanediol dehydrogenase / meso-butanediol dehydrogenase / diacetyl reductase n=1 Tax=Klenkia taihuensis TaxID=1225127 RepID=A0A1I1U4S5_9ACTN|nr:2,3-butanediol dehydrogenase [Klenkia taihuensis]GHE06987.1 alcohol dehydrogenase [Klenkia taihuensis]SFD64618.1 (R,R)-butanediol dehydrogenase / meso-butanediol dehydrogenase / diacetyl reductase [Klenkia taihuensis]